MPHSPLMVSLVFATAAAVLGVLLAIKLRQSPVLGYILAGLAIGPFTPGLVGDVGVVQALADVGVVFLMFAIGVEISLKELIARGRVAALGGLAQVAIVTGLCFLAGLALGWGQFEALFLGAAVAISSTTALTKVLGERGEMGSLHGQIALAWSAVQDFATVILVVVLSAAAGGGDVLPNLLVTLGKAVGFLAVLSLVGYLALPMLFERIAALQSRELFIFAVVATALGAAYASSLFGLSLALGAFVAGVVVGESDLSLQILGELMPLRDVFAGLFFVSVGMFINPALLVANPIALVVALLLIMPVKALVTAVLTRVFGYSARTSVLTGASLAQSAEFSFLLASLGAGLGVVGQSAFGIILAASAISVILTPGLYVGSLPLAALADRRFPLPDAESLEAAKAEAVRGHAVVCGYGRVGRVIVDVLRRRRFPVVVVEEDIRKARELRARGVGCVVGNAGNPVVLERLGLERARVLVVAIPDALTARQIVSSARQTNPRLDVVARSHSREERRFLRQREVTEVVLAESELALEMTRHTLHRFGVSLVETQATIQRLRERLAGDEVADREDVSG
jgi:K+:H+ antiporter